MISDLPESQHVLIGFSGGADSSAAAAMLKEQGWSVTACYLMIGKIDDRARETAERTARSLGIPFITKDVSSLFERTIIKDFCGAYEKGNTPNPCVFCNPSVKFKALIGEADRLSIPHIATGHYARVRYGEAGRTQLLKAANEKKDQSYMLYRLSSEVLNRCLFPLGDINSKQEVRALLRKLGIAAADSPDSQDICFIEGQNYRQFLESKDIRIQMGSFVDAQGQVLGTHQGIHRYTPGQRKGLGISFGMPMYVISSDRETNTVLLGKESDLYKTRVWIDNMFFTDTGDVDSLPQYYADMHVEVKLRYTAHAAPATLHRAESGAMIVFNEPQRAPAPGQSAVLYDGLQVLGGGIIAYAYA